MHESQSHGQGLAGSYFLMVTVALLGLMFMNNPRQGVVVIEFCYGSAGGIK
jgi:hypothetical protein